MADADIRVPFDNRPQDRLRGLGMDRVADTRMAAPQVGDDAGQQRVGQKLQAHHDRRAAPQTAQRVDLGDRRFELAMQPAGGAKQQLAGGGQPHPARQALEQRNAEVALELENLPVDRRRRHVQMLGRAPDRPVMGDGLERAHHGFEERHGT